MTRICLHIDDPCKFELVWHILQQQQALICLDTHRQQRQQQSSAGHNKISFLSVHAIVCFVCFGSFCDTVKKLVKFQFYFFFPAHVFSL